CRNGLQDLETPAAGSLFREALRVALREKEATPPRGSRSPRSHSSAELGGQARSFSKKLPKALLLELLCSEPRRFHRARRKRFPPKSPRVESSL
ncbi:unnamed protein product, partial [Gulo gulo]